MTLAHLGIDISKAKFDVALLRAGKLRHKVFPNRPEGFAQLAAWLAKQGVTKLHACLEATGTYSDELALFLHDGGHLVSLVNPACIKAFAQSQLVRTKTDKVDAGVIARFCAAQDPPPWVPPAPEVRHLQALMRRLESLTEMRQQEVNRLAGGPKAPEVIASLKEHIEYLDREIGETKKLARDHIEGHPELKRQQELLTSIPGIAELTAAKLLAEVTDWSAFDSARQVAAYAGLTPRQRISGSSVRGKSRLSKTGNAKLRGALYMPAVVAIRRNPVIKAFCARLRERGLRGKALVGAAMRKLLHQVYGVLKSGRNFDPDYEIAA